MGFYARVVLMHLLALLYACMCRCISYPTTQPETAPNPSQIGGISLISQSLLLSDLSCAT